MNAGERGIGEVRRMKPDLIFLVLLFAGVHAVVSRRDGTAADRAAVLIALTNVLTLAHTLLSR
ncbi:hypothetical protein ABZ442_02760 [Streptomyces triculaminicus]|uniref:hypothetical protein n=1 Tax=Streptomyces triculaminicus TaxID=2816232 RepID=UPI0033EB6BC8